MRPVAEVLREADGATLREIAALAGVSPSCAARTLRRLRREGLAWSARKPALRRSRGRPILLWRWGQPPTQLPLFGAPP